MPISDEEFVNLVEAADNILSLQEELKQKMANGIFSMAIARKGGCAVSSFSIREDINANVTVSQNSDTGDFELWEKKPEVNPLLLISGLPPPSLKTAQKHFVAAIRDAIDLAGLVYRTNQLYLPSLKEVNLEEKLAGMDMQEATPNEPSDAAVKEIDKADK